VHELILLFILTYLDLTESIKLLKWLQKIQRWVNKVLLARGNMQIMTFQELEINRRLESSEDQKEVMNSENNAS
jgi:hypothetical protein